MHILSMKKISNKEIWNTVADIGTVMEDGESVLSKWFEGKIFHKLISGRIPRGYVD